MSRLIGWLSAVAVFASGATPSMAADGIETAVRVSYPSILGSWAAGDRATALARLAEMEIDLMRPDYRPRDIEVLWRAKLGVIRDLMGQKGADVLPPIMMLHHDAYLDYLARNEAILAGHAKVMAEELAQVYARQRPDEHGRSVAASVLTSLGGYLQHGWSSHGSALLFALAVDIDETAEAAYIGLGALYERRSELNEAVAEFRKAVDISPDAAEARLRLGVNLKRLERFSEAERELEKLIDSGVLPWVETIAIEELGDLLGRSGEDPLPLLRKGVEKYPANSRLQLQLSFWLDRRGQAAESQGVVEEALLVIEPEPESPRYQYSRWPLTRLEAMRQNLRTLVGEHEAILAESVRGLAGDLVGAS